MFEKLLEPLYRWITGYMSWSGLILYGKDSPEVEPPNPALVEAQVTQLGIQSDIAREMVGISRELLPYQIEQMKLGIRAADTAYKDSRVDRAYTLDRRGHLTGLQNQIIGDANEYNTEAKQIEMAAQAGATVESTMAASEAAAARDMARRGVNPNSGASRAMENAQSVAKGGVKASAMNTGRTMARDEGRMLADRAANALAGYPSMSMSATQNGVANGMAGLSAVNQALGGIQSGYGAAAGASAGASQTASGLYGQQMSAYNNAQNNAAASNNANTQAWGTAAGMAAYALLSDRRIKVNIVKVGDDPRGFGWYTFDYLAGARGQFGVMAQEVAQFLPDAVTQKHGLMAVNYSML